MAPSHAMGILIRLVITAVSLWIATLVIDGIQLTADTATSKAGTLLAVAVIFGLINAILRPIIKTIGCGFYVLTLGLVAILVNGLLLLLTSWIAGKLELGFHVDGVIAAILGALLVGVVSWVLNMLVPDGDD
ncbi:hypothetical protein GCM10010112_36160 [Actinoplanes lobatus]|uniref:Phage holin family protein n=3 Tax=Actinoplanes TaxID=1865 RepID=A0ABQ4AG96_9ACTN|nr:hypothetical protein GCM10010112_36160 [Actinoplanes lobatus]GIE40028.1 hypothetical protein Alo02nite_29260 [Actinoplanes lobatus]